MKSEKNSEISLGSSTKIKRDKRDLLEIIDCFYDFLSKHDQIFLSDLRKIKDPAKRISSPTDRKILDLVQHIQDRPYVYVKTPERYTILKLSSQPRDPKTRYIQLNDPIEFLTRRSQDLRNQVEKGENSQYGLLLQQYHDLVKNTIETLKKIRDREKIS